jgi:glycerol-1-phosphate dehydrogenase [NAD(P)+]
VTSQTDTEDDAILRFALRHARDTRRLVIAPGSRREVDAMFGELFGNVPCIVVADDNTFAAAGKDVHDALRRAGRDLHEPLIFEPDGLYAEYSFVTQIQNSLATNRAIPIAVGAGAINDLTKLAAHLCGRRYISVATATSMDGYTAFGASITRDGAKQTLDCPAPLGIIADLDVIVAAPEGLNASGYADLIAKCPAGADWILADALGIDPIDDANWQMVQAKLHDWLADPLGVRRRDYEATRRLTMALMITGFAMQAACSSRPVSGAEHQFSHLWDMENHTHRGTMPSHGFKVGIGTLASTALYEVLLSTDVARLDVDSAVDAWPDAAANAREIGQLFRSPAVERKALLESSAKHIDRETLRAQLQLLKRKWPQIHDRLARQMIPRSEVCNMLRTAGCPVEPERIGISPERLRTSFRKAYHIRRRFTIFDVVRRADLWEPALDAVFATWKPLA